MSLLAKVGGFLFLPLAGGALLRTVSKETDTVGDLAYKAAAAHAALAVASYYASERLRGDFADFARGGMWGTGVGAAALALTPTLAPKTAKLPVSQVNPGYFERSGLPSASQEPGVKAILKAFAGA